MPDARYHIRLRGQVTGPYTREELLQMLARGSVSRLHQVSSDGKVWQQIREWSEFKESTPADQTRENHDAPAIRASDDATIALETISSTHTNEDQHQPPAATAPATDADGGWYYTHSGEKTPTGPADSGKIGQLIASGHIDASTLVWRDGMERWQPLTTTSLKALLPWDTPAVQPTSGRKAGYIYCSNCGQEIAERAVMCPSCGVSPGPVAQQAQSKDKGDISLGVLIAAYILGALFPIIGWVMAVVLLTRNRLGHAMAVGAISTTMFLIYVF